MYWRVPMIIPSPVSDFSMVEPLKFIPVCDTTLLILANPKSRTLAWPKFVTKMFAGLMYR